MITYKSNEHVAYIDMMSNALISISSENQETADYPKKEPKLWIMKCIDCFTVA